MMAVAKDFRQWLAHHRAVGDGAMATLLHQMGVPVRTCYEELCLSAPHLIDRVHQAYVAAGADIIQTNTFSGHRPGLERYDLGDKVADINRAAVRLAKKAADDKAFVFGTVGSIVGLQAGVAAWDQDQQTILTQQFTEQMTALLDENVDGLLLETFPNYSELHLAVTTARKLTHLPIIAHLSPEAIGVTRDGIGIEQAFVNLQAAGADVVGLNCQLGVAGIVKTFERVQLPQGGLYSAYPNAGLLEKVDDDFLYTAGPDYFGKMAQTLFELGVQLVGGCCGTTPEHVKAVVEARNQAKESKLLSAKSGPSLKVFEAPDRKEAERPTDKASVHATMSNLTAGTTSPVPSGNRTLNLPTETLIDKANRQTTVIVELDPPRTLDTTRFMEGAQALQNAGADYITLADNSLGHVRVSNMALASQLKHQGIEPLVHITCRDRNLIGQQSHLMGLHVLGIQHVLLVTGDPSRFGDLPGASSVYDTSSTELATMVKRLNSGIAFSGQHLKEPSHFVVGTSFNPNVKNLEKAYERLGRKVKAGADYVMTQPLYAKAQIEDLAQRTSELDVPVFVGIMPLVSARNANFLHNEVPGIHIPPEVLTRMNEAPSDSAWEVGLDIAKELIDEALQYFQSIYLITPFLRYPITVALVQYIREVTETKSTVASQMR